MKFLNVGIDVSADQLEVAYRGDDGKLGRVQFGNKAKDHRALIQYLRKLSRSMKVVMESTGIYGLDLALALEQTKEIEVMVANPRAVADFGKALLQRSKTDRADAVTILTFCERMPFVSWNVRSNSSAMRPPESSRAMRFCCSVTSC